MTSRCSILFIALLTFFGCIGLPAWAQSKYPDFSGQWTDFNTARWDPSKPRGRAQQAPLTPEYQAVFDTAAADRARGGFGNTPTITCGHTGMPRAMILYESMEFVIQPNIIHLLFDFIDPLRRIYTDGRDWPASIEPTWMGYSIGQWEGESGDGRYDSLVIETRGFKGPRILDGSGIPLHEDNQTIVKERMFLDKAKPDVLHDQITLIDHAFTRPYTVDRVYKRHRESVWGEYSCGENNEHVVLGREAYFISADGFLMPTRKDQPPPDTRYFNAKK